MGGSPQAIVIARGRAWVTVDARTLPPAGASSGGGTVRIDVPDTVRPMDPALSYDGVSAQLLYATCAKLVDYADRGGAAASQIVPEVARSLPSISADGRRYTFTIRRGFRFSPPSGEPVTAQTFKDSIERSLNSQMHSPVGYEFRDIVGAAAYMAGRTRHIAGVVARGNTLTITLTTRAPDFTARTTQSVFCAVPSNTPIVPGGLDRSRRPALTGLSVHPAQGIVLERNPNYDGNRPHRVARIEVEVGLPPRQAVAQVLAGTADFTDANDLDRADIAMLAARYGRGSPAARRGNQQYFVNGSPQLDFFALNTHRPLFSGARMRRAVNYAIDRTALARLGDEYVPLPEHPTDHYLPPGFPGYRNLHNYPLTPDRAKARKLAAGHTGATAVFYACQESPCAQQAQIMKTDLAAIGIKVVVKTFPDDILGAKLLNPGEPFDITSNGWLPDYLDPDQFLNSLLESGATLPTFDDRVYRARLDAAARLAGPRRYLAYAKLDEDVTRNAAPLVAFGNLSTHELFSSRIGCVVHGAYGVDLGALCVKKSRR